MKYFYMLLLGALVLCAGVSVSAQGVTGTYMVVDDAGLNDLAPYRSALDNARLDPYRNQDSRRVLQFDNGLKVELMSLNELESMGYAVDEDARRNAEIPKRDAVFTVKGGFLIEQVRPEGKSKH